MIHPLISYRLDCSISTNDLNLYFYIIVGVLLHNFSAITKLTSYILILLYGFFYVAPCPFPSHWLFSLSLSLSVSLLILTGSSPSHWLFSLSPALLTLTGSPPSLVIDASPLITLSCLLAVSSHYILPYLFSLPPSWMASTPLLLE